MSTKTKKDKLKELIVYVSAKCADDKTYGITKLNKIIFFADFFHYLNKGESISGQNYVHLDHGPVPEDMKSIRGEMDKRDIALAVCQSGPFEQKRVVALREADLSSFKPEMVSTLDAVIKQVSEENHLRAKWLSDLTHEFIGWRVTETLELIPYETFFLKSKRDQKVTERERNKALEIAKKLSGRYGFLN